MHDFDDDVDDFDDDFDGDEDGEGLIEIGRRIEGGREPTRLVRWTTGRLAAEVRPHGVRLRRRWGRTYPIDSLPLSWAELRALEAACRHWATHRGRWSPTYEQEHRGSGPFGPVWT